MSNLNFNYEDLAQAINQNKELNFIAVQFAKEFQNEAQIEIFEKISSKLNEEKTVYIIGDTSYGSCCCDEITAEHLDCDIIIRVGSSCFTRNTHIPIYFLFNNLNYSDQEKDSCINKINESIKNIDITKENIFLFYNEQTQLNLISKIKENFKEKLIYTDIENDEIPINKQKNDNLLYGRNMHNKNIEKDSNIIYIGKRSDYILDELIHRYINKIKSINFIDMNNFEIENIAAAEGNTFLYKRFNLIQKAKEASTFGILVGSLSLPNLNDIIYFTDI